MNDQTRITRTFENALILPLVQDSKYILFSDCHRGVGNANDNFLKNEFLFLAALNFYYQKGFTYLELGDGDELWENRSIQKIKEMHPRSFEMMMRYYNSGRMYALYGNHDMIKKNFRYTEKHFHTFYCEHALCEQPLFPGITFHAGIILRDTPSPNSRSAQPSARLPVQTTDIYLIHGHQTDPLNSTFWRLSRFLVRYVWKPLEGLGIPDPTSAAKNNTKKKVSEERLSQWAKTNHHILIAGHTHHPMIGTTESPYFNTGSCIHPSGITGIEIEDRCITLVKWSVQAKNDMSLAASREILGKPICIDTYHWSTV